MSILKLKRIAVVEDEEDVANLISLHLRREGALPFTFEEGESFLTFVEREPCHLVILDLMLPGIDGIEILRLLKLNPSTSRIPVIILTAKGEEADRVLGLEMGADDYMVKPFSPRELVARAKAILRRTGERAEEAITLGSLSIDRKRRSVSVKGKEIDLSPTEFSILEALAVRRGEAVSRRELLEVIGNPEASERTVDVHIRRIREKLKGAGDMIKTVRGWGYRLRWEASQEA